MRRMAYKVGLRHTDEGYSVSCPGLPGCWSQGTTAQEALANIQDAIREYLAAAAELNPDAEIREVSVSLTIDSSALS
jgi:predicted RNase H-like HicB family nuclease